MWISLKGTRNGRGGKALILMQALSLAGMLSAGEYHVAVNGCDSSKGSASQPFKTISAAAQVAQPGDVVTVHAGTYREGINPPRGGASESQRIVYQAAEGDQVIITGAEVVKNWSKTTNDTWTVTLPNRFFGSFNPYSDLIHGDWFSAKGRQHHTGAVYLDGHWLTEAARMETVLEPVGNTPFWFAQVDESDTTLWAQFKDVCPNERLVEINVRQTVFYPDQPGRNYITVRGFTLEKAATPWAPPTAEQKGLIGTHWSKGWIIEDNTIRYSVCSGITLGKYGDEWDNKSATADKYNHTIERALGNGWNKATVGSHVVRNNTVSHCEQAGIVGSLGAVFSTITGNTIHDIHVRRHFSGSEMAGIKLHAAIDVQIVNNHIYRTWRGIWLDWMAQGTHVAGNLLHDNDKWEMDLFIEVNHGPLFVYNNIFLSSGTLMNSSQGSAFAHNLIAGTFRHKRQFDARQTPFHKANSTEIAGVHDNPNGDDRFYNNIFIQRGDLTSYDTDATLPVVMEGNVFLNGAKPSKHETQPLVKPDFDPALKLVEKEDGFYLSGRLDRACGTEQPRKLVTTELLGKARIPNVPFVNADGSDIKITSDYFGTKRNPANPFPGPFELSGDHGEIKVWPRE